MRRRVLPLLSLMLLSLPGVNAALQEKAKTVAAGTAVHQ